MVLTSFCAVLGLSSFLLLESDAKVLSTLDEYKPSPAVDYFSKGTPEDVEFDPYSVDYLTKAAYPMAGFIALWAVLLVLFVFVLFCKKITGCHFVSHVGGEVKVLDDGRTKYKKNLVIFGLWYVMVAGAFLSDQMIFLGNGPMNDGVDVLLENAQALRLDIFDKISEKATSMEGYAQDGVDLSSTSSCVSSMNSTFDTMLTSATAIYSMTSAASEGIEPFENILEDYGKGPKDAGIFSLYTFVVIALVLFIIFELCESKFGLHIMMTFSWFILWAAVIILGILLFALNVLGDYCMDPTGLTLNLLGDAGNSSAGMVSFYLSRDDDGYICDGSDPLAVVIDAAQTIADEANSTLVALTNQDIQYNGGACATDLTNANSYIQNYVADFTAAGVFLDCVKFNTILTKTLENGVCAGLATGLGMVWQALCSTMVFVFMLMCCSSLTTEYFGAVENKVVPTAVEAEMEVYDKDPSYNSQGGDAYAADEDTEKGF